MDSENGVSAADRRARIESPAGQRLVAAMRASIGRRGIAGSTFDQIGAEAEVRRGSIAWYVGTKERLIAEVMRADADERLGRLHDQLGRAESIDELIAASERLLEEFLDAETGAHVLVQEMRSLAFRNGAIGEVQTELRRRWRQAFVELLVAKTGEGVIDPIGKPEGTATLLTALAQGIAAEAMADADWDRGETVRQAAEAVRHVLGAGRAAGSSGRRGEGRAPAPGR